MAYNEAAALLIRKSLANLGVVSEEKKMFGGIAFMINNKMALGVIKDDIMIRVQPELQHPLLENDFIREMDFTGRPMKGYYYLNEDGYYNHRVLSEAIELVLAYNAIARKSVRKNKK